MCLYLCFLFFVFCFVSFCFVLFFWEESEEGESVSQCILGLSKTSLELRLPLFNSNVDRDHRSERRRRRRQRARERERESNWEKKVTDSLLFWFLFSMLFTLYHTTSLFEFSIYVCMCVCMYYQLCQWSSFAVCIWQPRWASICVLRAVGRTCHPALSHDRL